MNELKQLPQGLLLNESGYPFFGIQPPSWIERLDTFFAGRPIGTIADPPFRLSAALCRRMGDLDLYHQWIRKALDTHPSPWWSAAFATSSLVGYFSTGKSLLDASSAALDHLYGLSLKPKEQDFSKGKFWKRLREADAALHRQLTARRPFIDEAIRWRDVAVHRLPPRVRVLSDGPPTKNPEATTKDDVQLGISEDPELDMVDALLGRKVTWISPSDLLGRFTENFHAFSREIAETLLAGYARTLSVDL